MEQQQHQSAQDQEAQEPLPTNQFPVVVFSHGLSAMRTISSGICYDLASHGYVVAAVEHRYVDPDTTAVDIKLLLQYVDISFDQIPYFFQCRFPKAIHYLYICTSVLSV